MCISMSHSLSFCFLGSQIQGDHFVYLPVLLTILNMLQIKSSQTQDYFTDRDNFDLSAESIKDQQKSSKAIRFKGTEGCS